MKATAEERVQMRAVAEAAQGAAFTRFSIGVTSLTPEARARLMALVQSGAFDGLRGVVTWGTTMVAEKRGDVWAFKESGGHALLKDIAARFDSSAIPIGIVPRSRDDVNFDQVIEVVAEDGRIRALPVVHTDNQDGTQLSIADVEAFKVIRGVVTPPQNYDGNIRIWHIEGLRSAEFGSMFNRSAVIFASGGGVILWEAEHLAERCASDPGSPFEIVLLKGLGGSTDALAGRNDWVQKHQEIGAKRGKPYLHIIDVDADPGGLRRFLEASGRIKTAIAVTQKKCRE